MSITGISVIRNAVAELWATPPADGATPRASLAFPLLVAACKTLNPRLERGFGDLALENAVRALGAPWMSVGNVRTLPPSPDDAAQRLAAALVATRGRRVHLCPLDSADELPRWRFGNNRITKMTASELDAVVSPARLLRHHDRWVFDCRAFARVQWLVVEEDVPLHLDPAIRAVPILGTIIGDVDGRIAPHAARLPNAVEDALFALLLQPWEDVVEHSKFDWRPFRTPWVYTVDEDILASPAAPPDPASLQWTIGTLNGADNEVIYDERPDVWPLDTPAVKKWPLLDDGIWQRLQAARCSKILTRPVAHFLVRAFLTEGIDEFLAHITTIEAALALPHDHYREPGAKKKLDFQQASPGQSVPWRPKLQDGSDPGATDRLVLRITALLGSDPRDHEFRDLYGARSDFLHGASMPDIPATQRLGARRLARRVTAELVRHAAEAVHVERVEFLSSLCP